MARFWSVVAKADELHRATWRFPSLTFPLRLLSSTANRLLELLTGMRHPNNRAVATFRSARAEIGSEVPAVAQLDVLFFTVRGWYAHVGTEAILAHGLATHGASSGFYLCGGQLSQCDFKPGSDPFVTAPLCWRCTGFGERILDAAGFKTTQLHDLVPAGSRAAAESLVAGLSRAQLLAFEYQGLPLGELVMPSVQHALLQGSVGEDRANVEVLRGFVSSAVVMMEACRELLKRWRPQAVFMTNGLFFAEAVMMNLALEAGLRVITYERGVRPNTIVIAANRTVIPFDMDSIWRTVKDRPLTLEQDAELDEMLAERRSGRVGSQVLWPSITGADLDHGASSRTVLFSNVTWDTAVFNASGAFENMEAWIRHTVELFRSLPEHELVIRAHPAEVRLGPNVTREPVAGMLSSIDGLPPNVRFVGPEKTTSSYELIESADAVLVYASTIGLEAAVSGKRVVVAGDTHYKNRGFTRDPASPADYDFEVRRSFVDAAEPSAIDLARRYAHGFFFEFNVDFPWLKDTSRGSREIDLEGIAGSPEMKSLCEFILGRGLA